MHFAVVVGTSSFAVDRTAQQLSRALERTRVLEGELLSVAFPSAISAVVAISSPDPTLPSRLSTADDSIAVINGPAFGARIGPPELVDRARQAFSSDGTSGVAEMLGGTYNFVGATPTAGLRAFTDFSGLYPLYWHQGGDVAVFSNRCSTLRSVTAAPEWDLRALAWIIGHANLFGDRMPARDVSYLVPGWEAHVDPGECQIRLNPSHEWVWPSPSDEPLREDLTPDEWDGITDDLLANVRRLRALDTRLQLMLSGGKDSRLCLALAKAARLDDDIVCVTNGAPGGPEVRCAAAVAEASGFRHQIGALPIDSSTPAGEGASMFESEWRRLRRHVYRYEAIVCPRDGTTDPASSTTLQHQGVRRGALPRPRRTRQTVQAEVASNGGRDGDDVRRLPPAARPSGCPPVE